MFESLMLFWMLILILFTVYPIHVVWESPEKNFLGFHYDQSTKVVVPPLWLLVAYSVFLLFLSGSYLYFWNNEILSGNYKFQNFLFDALILLSLTYFVTIPMIQKTAERIKNCFNQL